MFIALQLLLSTKDVYIDENSIFNKFVEVVSDGSVYINNELYIRLNQEDHHNLVRMVLANREQ